MTTLDELAAEFGLDGVQTAALGRYLDLLLGWRAGNVTGVRTRAGAVDRLLGDSLALLDVPALGRAGDRWLDLGAGAGVPGIPLAVARPAARLVLLDAEAKKCAFLQAAVAEAGIGDRASVVHARSEAFAAADAAGAMAPAGMDAAPGLGGREAFDVVLARAVAGLATVVELAAPLLAPGGVLLAVKTTAGAERETPGAAAAASECGLGPADVVLLSRSPLPGSVCVVYAKVASAPGWLPRRAGLAQKRPLGA